MNIKKLNADHSNASQRAGICDYLELMRLPNVFTSIADVAMGFLFVREVVTAADAWLMALFITASSLLYLAGMVLNDVFDIEQDTSERPDRPLPSGRISLNAARWFGWALLFGGSTAGLAASFIVGHILTGSLIIILATCILSYDAGLKSTVIGPVMMGSCRMFNVLFGMSAAGGPFIAENWIVAAAIGIYIAGVTWFARTENARSLRLNLSLATIVILAGVAVLSSLSHWSERINPLLQIEPQRWWMLMLVLGILIGWRCVHAIITPNPVQVQFTVAQSILSLIILDAATCFAIRDLYWSVAILLLLFPAMYLGKSFKMT